MKQHIFYIPGLGDHYDVGRSVALKLWRLFGVRATLVPMKWYEGGTYATKLTEVATAVKKAKAAGERVTLIGESAGASLALNAAAVLPQVDRVITLAGVNSSQLPISPRIFARSPAFADSSRAIDTSLTTLNPRIVHTVRALWDPVVSPKYDRIQGAHHHVVFAVGHLTSIVLLLTIYSPYVIYLVKRGNHKHIDSKAKR